MSRLGRIGPLVWHMPLNANLAFREFGIALFFASVGLMAGPQFFATVFSAGAWSGWPAVCVTVVPILIVGSCPGGVEDELRGRFRASRGQHDGPAGAGLRNQTSAGPKRRPSPTPPSSR